MQETLVLSLGWEDSLEEEMATHSNILTWKIPCTEALGGLQSVGSQRVRHNLATKLQQHIFFSLSNDTETITYVCTYRGFLVAHQ